jgi:molybdopterin synthase sulfur carrier subunit
MTITVHFFASLRELTGIQKTDLDYTGPIEIDAIWSLATGDIPMPDNTLCAINMEYVKTDAVISDGDEVAFFPPVTGG